MPLPPPLNELTDLASNLLRKIDVLWFRWMAVAFSAGGIAYKTLYPHETPVWLAVTWNIIFILINLIHIQFLLRERHGVHFSEEEKELYDTIFYRFSPVEYMKLMRLAQWRSAPAGEMLAEEDKPLGRVLLIYNGSAEVKRGGATVAYLRDGDFIGEMSFITEGNASATVSLSRPTRLVEWPKQELRQLLERNPAMSDALHTVVATDLTKKLLVRQADAGEKTGDSA